MSFDIFVQRFRAGDGVEADATRIRKALAPHLEEAAGGVPRLRAGAGTADIYGLDDLASGFMVNHVKDPVIFDVLVEVSGLRLDDHSGGVSNCDHPGAATS